MSFRHTYITEFLYNNGRDEKLKAIKDILEKEGTVNWEPSFNDNQLGYFHGVIKDLNSYDTKNREQEIIHKLKKVGCDIKIVFES